MNLFRSIAFKLAMAFLLVGVIGLVLFAVLIGQRSRQELSQFLSARDQGVLVNALADYYEEHNGWDGVEQMVATRRPLNFYFRNAILADSHGLIVLSTTSVKPGANLTPDDVAEVSPIVSGGRTVGYIRFASPNVRGATDPLANELNFVRNVTGAAWVAGIVAALFALLLGFLLARTLTRPLRELTAATNAMAAGNLNQRVTVRSKDEIGRLAVSFNQMSSDLARASQTRKQMTADLAHDLRTPLTILRGYAEGLKEGRLQGTPTLYGIMHGEIEHLQRLVEDLRVLSLADAGELSLNRRSVDPAALLERCGLAHFQQAEELGLTVRVDAAPDLPSILVDTDRMAQVLNNLVTNALKHTSAGEVALTASVRSGKVLLSVRDSGEGIAPEHLPYVFDRFYRADSSRQRADSQESVSSGLGLAIAKAIVEAHGGTLSVESTVGVGSTFTVSLPVSEAPLAPAGKHEAIRLPKVIR